MQDLNTYQPFFQLLRYAMGSAAEMPVGLSAADWERIYEQGRQQSLLGLLFDGIQRGGGEKPERKLLLRWYAMSEQIREKNRKANQATVKLVDFFRKHGFRTCILKGQGNTLNYPAPGLRTSGDVDIWVEGGQERVLAFARKYVGKAKFCYHHIDFRNVDGVASEVHYRPSFMNSLVHDHRMQRWFDEVADTQFTHEVELPEGAGRVCVPTDAFNRIYQLTHISRHFFQAGIGLRQLVDYYFLLMRGFTAEEQLEEERLMRRFGLYDVARAVMYVLREMLGLPPERMLVPADERLGRFLLEEIMLSGNFGQYDQRVDHEVGPVRKNLQRLQRDARLMRLFPSECLWEPVFRWYHFFWRLHHR